MARPTVDRYALLGRLGQGGMGVVYHAVHAKLGTEVAIKLLPLALHAQQQGLIERFEREARLAAQLRSDHLVSVLDVAEDDATGCHFIVMEYVHGLSADAWMRAHAGAPNVPEAEALDVCIAAVSGLAAAHLAGVVHRDIKPANILIPCDAGSRPLLDRAKLADLGLARREAGESGITDTSVAMGTPGFMAPEQATDAKRAKKGADVFSVGATLYALLTGTAPFAGSSPADAIVRTVQGTHRPLAEARPSVSRATALLVATCLARDPAQRFADAPALLDALRVARAALAQDDTLGVKAVTTLRGLVSVPERGAPVVTPAPQDAGGADAVSRATGWVPTPSVLGVLGDPRTPAPTTRRRVKPFFGAALVVAAAALGVAVSLRGDSEPRTPLAPDLRTPAAEKPGLYLTSEPAGASASVDGAARGLTPVLVTDLAEGRHAIEIRLDDHEPFESRDAASRIGERTEFHASLVRARGQLSIRGGAPAARIVLTRSGGVAAEFTFDLDEKGSLSGRPVEAGDYAVTASCHGFAPHKGRIRIRAGEPASLDLSMPELDGTVSVESDPQGAEVLIDGTRVGTTPLRRHPLPAGRHAVHVQLAEHVAAEVPLVTVRGDRNTPVGPLALMPWPRVDLSGLEAGVVAERDGRVVADGQRVPPGPLSVVLRRADHAPQEVAVLAVAGSPVVVRARPWAAFQAQLDSGRLSPGVRASIAGKPITGVVPFTEATQVEVTLEREFHRPQVRRYSLSLGETAIVEEGPWEPLPGTLDLSALGPDVVAQVDGVAVRTGSSLPPGTRDLLLRREGFLDQVVTVTVLAGRPVRVEAPAWVKAPLSAARARSLLTDVRRWDSASPDDRRQAAALADQARTDFDLLRMETFTCGGQTHEVAVFRHPGTGLEFVLVPVGTFAMGSPPEEDGRNRQETLHMVTLTSPFLVARTEVTQAAWDQQPEEDRRERVGKTLPITGVSWPSAKIWCERLGMRLPTEAEWEYACRASSTTRYGSGDDLAALDRVAWHAKNSGGTAHPVAEKLANAFGLFDVHGNVWEWCADGFAEYPTVAATDPKASPSASATRVYRGGSWYAAPSAARSANRFHDDPASRTGSLGLRPVADVTIE